VDPILSSGVFLAVLYAKMCAVGVNTLLTTSAPEPLIHEWYQGLYTDTYTDYLEMARYWYHGRREVARWMDRAQEQLGEEDETVHADTNRDAFIALATGNTHAHANYVLLRQLRSFPLPLRLRKDPRTHYFNETRTALLRHTGDRSGEALATPADMRKAVLRMRDEAQPVGERFAIAGSGASPSINKELTVSPKVRLSLEAIDDVVTLVVRAPNGERRAVDWHEETDMLAAFAEAKPPGAVAGGNGLADDKVLGFCGEMVEAGVFVPVIG
jgi:hypothetical protein